MTGNSLPNAFLFDLDGTLADSLAIMRDVYDAFARKHDFVPTNEEFDHLNGPSLPEIIAYLKDTHSLPGCPQKLLAAYNALIIEAYTDSVLPFPSATPLLKLLRQQGKQVFLVTSSSQEVAQAFIKRCNWGTLFQGAVFGNEVRQAKPNGEIYELALSRFSLTPDEAIAIEDSVNGVKAAQNAKLKVLGISEQHTPLLSSGASAVFDSLHKLFEELNNELCPDNPRNN